MAKDLSVACQSSDCKSRASSDFQYASLAGHNQIEAKSSAGYEEADAWHVRAAQGPHAWGTSLPIKYNGLLGIMPLQWFDSCSDMTLVQLRNFSMTAWTHTVILALRARHQISPRWLEVI